MEEGATLNTPAFSGDFECRRKPYADHCLCQSCTDTRRLQASPRPPAAPPLSSEDDDDDDSELTTPETDPLHDDEYEYRVTEVETVRVNEPRCSRSTQSLMASDPAASRRPVLCPLHECRRHIAVNTLVSHFRFEHPEVHRVCLSSDASTLTVRIPRLHNLPPLATECAAILTIACEDEEKRLVPDMWNLVLAYAVMPDGGFVAWVFGLLEGDQRISAMLSMEQEEHWPARDSGDFEDVNIDSRKIAVLSPSTFKVRSMSFFGPVLPLRESQEPLDVLERGDCLYVPPGLVACFSSASQGMALQLNIAF